MFEKYHPLTQNGDNAALKAEYSAGRTIGNVVLGETHFFFKEKRKICYVPYTDITRVFRRVVLVQTKMCCGKGNLEVENIVICNDGGELAQVQLPGARAGIILLEEMAKKAPHAQIGKPN